MVVVTKTFQEGTAIREVCESLILGVSFVVKARLLPRMLFRKQNTVKTWREEVLANEP